MDQSRYQPIPLPTRSQSTGIFVLPPNPPPTPRTISPISNTTNVQPTIKSFKTCPNYIKTRTQ